MKYKRIHIGDTFIVHPRYSSYMLKIGIRYKVNSVEKPHGYYFGIDAREMTGSIYHVNRHMGDVIHVNK